MTDVEARLVEPMATNLSAENTSPTLKRKASEDGEKASGKALAENVVLKKLKPEPPSSDVDEIEVIKVVKTKSIKSETPKDKKSTTAERKIREGTSTSTASRRSASPVKKSKLSAEEQEAARVKKEAKEAEKEAKRAEKEAQKAEKEARKAEKEAQKAEKEAQRDAQKAEKDALKAKKDAEKNAKKEAAQKAIDAQEAKKAKQASMLASFLHKKPAAPVSRESPAGPSSAPTRSVSPEKESEYRRTFREIPKRANVAWASMNTWTEAGSVSAALSTDDLEEWGMSGSPAVSGWSSKDFLKDHLSRHNIASSSSSRLPSGLKSAPAYKPVSEVWSMYLESDDPRKVIRHLKNKDKFPFKTLAFDQQDRPPYRGTFTKSSAVVGPRTPFTQDPIFDYSYDSADEWVEDEGGEDVDDPEEELEEDEDEGDSDAGEFDDWLDDSEDAVFGPEHMEVDTDPLEQSKLPMKVVKKPKPKKKIVKLTPTWDGPLWESDIGKGNGGFEEYRIQLLNDTPSSIDPFTYVGSDPPQAFKTTYGVASMGLNSSVKCLLSAKHVATPKDVPTSPKAGSVNGDSKATADADSTKGTSAGAPIKPRPAVPKIVFPALYLPQLVKIVQGSTKSRVDLLSELKNEFGTVTSKAAIETKLKEVASRNGVKKDSTWVVKPEFLDEKSMPSSVTTISASPVVDSSTF